MNLRIVNWTLAALLVGIGCVPSLNPVFRDDQCIFDRNLLGVWSQPRSSDRWEVTTRDESSYRVVYTDPNGHQNRFIGHLADVEGTLFLDLLPEAADTADGGFYRFHMVPIHTVYRVERTATNLGLSAIDFKWFDEYLTDHPDAIPFAESNGRKLITAPTEQVQTFVLQHKEMFTQHIRLERSY